jgi:cyanophycin synthetase
VIEAVAPTGTAVLNAADPLVAAMAPTCPGQVIYFARDGGQPVLAAHRRDGGRVAFIHAGSIALAEGDREEVLTSLERVPLTHQGKVAFQVENVLSAAAAAWALGTPLDSVRAGLASFTGDAVQVPGRFNVFPAGAATVIVDYAHNPSALDALVEALATFPHRRRTLVYSGCNRRDTDIVRMGEAVGHGFDRVILYEDRGNNDRTDGELNALLRRGLAAGKRVAETLEARDEPRAVELALQVLTPSELLVIGTESIEGTLALVQRHIASRPGQSA